MSVAERALEQLPSILRPAVAAPAAVAPAPVSVSIPAADQALPPAVEESMQNEFIAALKAGVDGARGKFRAGEPAASVASAIWQGKQEPANNALVSAIYEGATLERLYMFVPEIQQDPAESAWFQQLYQSLSTLVRG